MTLDASTPEKLRDSIASYIARSMPELNSDMSYAALRDMQQVIANATLVTPKTREVWAVVTANGVDAVDVSKEWIEKHQPLTAIPSRVVRATLTLHEEV